MEQPTRVHCYTNPSFCRHSEFMPNCNDELPPPPQFQEDLPLPPPPPPSSMAIPINNTNNVHHQMEVYQGHTNPAFQTKPEADIIESANQYQKTPDRYCYLEDADKRINKQLIYNRQVKSRYEYIDDEDDIVVEQQNRPVVIAKTPNQLQRRASLSKFEMISKRQSDYNFVRQGSYHGQQMQNYDQRTSRRLRQNGEAVRYALVPADEGLLDDELWMDARSPSRGRYARVPMDEEPPLLPERNSRDQSDNNFSSRNNLATQRLHEILSTPRKPRSKSEDRNLSPGKMERGTPPRNSQFSPPISLATSPTGRGIIPGSSHQSTPISTPQRTFSPLRGPKTSTPNKESPSARRCLPLNEQQELCPASNCGRVRYQRRDGTSSLATSPTELSRFTEPPPRYAFVESNSELVPMVIGSPKYQVISSSRSDQQTQQKKDSYDIESAFLARTAVVTPMSPPSEVNTTIASGLDKNERKNAPLLLILVGILTSGLAIYLSWTKGRQYYYDSAAGCGICCTLAGACRTLRKTWTGLCLAGLSAISCAGLLILAAKSPRPGTPFHDVTAGALCGVSLLGAGLALIALIAPRCSFGRHRRVHSWMPRFSQ